MLCQDCPAREHCVSPCEALEEELSACEGYQRELVMEPWKLELLAESFMEMYDMEMFNRSEIDAAVKICMELVSEEQREAVELYFDRGLNMEEIGRLLGINRSSVHRRLKRARKAVKEMMELMRL